MKLSERLETLIAMVPSHSQVLDVGCDHGYVSIELVKRGIASSAIASDLREGPLAAAKEHIKEAGFSAHVTAKCCDGIPDHFQDAFYAMGDTPSHVVCLILGMGGILMRDILQRGEDRLDQIQTFLFSPQSDQRLFRLECQKLGLQIKDEKMVKEDGKFYVLIKAEHGPYQSFSECELRFGPILLKKRDPVLKEYLMHQKNTLLKISESLEKQNSKRSQKRAEEVLEDLTFLNEALSRFHEQQKGAKE